MEERNAFSYAELEEDNTHWKDYTLEVKPSDTIDTSSKNPGKEGVHPPHKCCAPES